MSERFNELLPWYVNGTLAEADRAWVEQYLAEHPQAREELEWFRSLQTQLRQDAPAVPQAIGLARTMHLIRGDRPTLAERFAGMLAALGMRPSLALAGVALMALQGGVIHHLLQRGIDDEAAQIRSVDPATADASPLLKVHFSASAREVDVRLALVGVQGNVAAGPDSQGDYFVRVPTGTEAQSIEQLKANASVSSVSLVTVLPARL
jgi:anti-sigma factor RsiW